MMNIASNLNRRGGLHFHGVSVVHLQPCQYRLAPEVAGEAVRDAALPSLASRHHDIEQEASDVNFSIQFLLNDRMFGTHHLPVDRWPEGYGVGGHPVPSGYVKQMLYPLQK
jgi:hypothetical protein